LQEYRTTYNAIDTTPLYLIGAHRYYRLTQDRAWLQQHSDSLSRAFQYIIRHTSLEDNYFETPRFCGAPKFALAVTYWKDSPWVGRPDGIPVWPVTYTLVQAQALAAVRSYNRLSAVSGVHGITRHPPILYLEAGVLLDRIQTPITIYGRITLDSTPLFRRGCSRH